MSNPDVWKDPKKRKEIYKWAKYYYNKENKMNNNQESNYIPPKKKFLERDFILILCHPILYYKWKKKTDEVRRKHPENDYIRFDGLLESRRLDRIREKLRKRNLGE